MPKHSARCGFYQPRPVLCKCHFAVSLQRIALSLLILQVQALILYFCLLAGFDASLERCTGKPRQIVSDICIRDIEYCSLPKSPYHVSRIHILEYRDKPDPPERSQKMHLTELFGK